jgi:hypothetical protein
MAGKDYRHLSLRRALATPLMVNGAKNKKPLFLFLIALNLSIIQTASSEQYINFGLGDKKETEQQQTETRDSLKETFRGYQIDLSPTYYRYTEPNLMHLKGINYRGSAEYTFFLSENSTWLMHIDYSFAYAKVDYSSFRTGSIGDEKNTINELKVNVGRATYFAGYPLKYYWGLAYRQLDHDGRGTSTTGHTGYQRRSQYYTLSGGYKWLIPLSNSWDFSLKNEISLLPYGKQTSYVTLSSSGSGKTTHDQHFGVNFRLIPNFVLAKHFVFGPYIDLWYVAESERNYEGGGLYSYEPENNTVEFGLLVGARF